MGELNFLRKKLVNIGIGNKKEYMNYDIDNMYVKTYTDYKLEDGEYDCIWQGNELRVKIGDSIYYFPAPITHIGAVKGLITIKEGKVSLYCVSRNWGW